MESRDAYVEKLKAQIDSWNSDIEKMRAKAREASADAQVKYNEQIEEMKSQRDAAEAKMKEARESSEEAWSDMRAGFESAWSSMSDSFSKAMKRFQ